MSTRQYIGARYVPKFFDWDGSAEWRSGVEYEALTIVTRNGNSYTSKIPVPSNIGAPESNPTYWVATGLYNDQIESIRQGLIGAQGDIDTLESNVGTLQGNVETLQGNVGTLQGNVETLQGNVGTLQGAMSATRADVDSLNNKMTTAEGNIFNLQGATRDLRSDLDLITPSNRRYIFVADSYGMRATPSYIEHIKTYLGLDDTSCYKIAVSGASFARPGVKFLTQLQNASASIADHSTITDIVVGGGFNDANYYRNGTINANDILNAINEFATYCKTEYPNAKLWLHFDAYCNNVLSNDSTVGTDGAINLYIGRTEALYAISARYGFAYMHNVKYTLHNSSFLDDTYYHPNANGNIWLANNVIEYLLGGECSVRHAAQLTFTPASGLSWNGTAPIFIEEINNDVATLSMGYPMVHSFFTIDGNMTFQPQGDEFLLGSFNASNALFCGAKQYCCCVPVTQFDANASGQQAWPCAGVLILRGCNLYIALTSVHQGATRLFIGGGTMVLPTMGADNNLLYKDV